MGCQTKQDYNYAFNSSGHLVHIHSANKSDIYNCPCCGSIMVPHMGQVRKWHFTHKAGAFCNFESYLHIVAKARIKEAFLNSDKFYIVFNPLHYCSIEKCPIHKFPRCSNRRQKKFELKQFYDICDEEVEYDGFRPDLLLCSSIHPEREPIFIEIFVSHKSTDKKISSGHRIIEISLVNEDDINLIISNNTIKGFVSDSQYYHEECNTVFYNFIKSFPIQPSESLFESKYIFALSDNGYFTVDRYYCFESYDEQYPPYEYNIIVSNVPINWQWAFSEFQRRGLNIINCLRCKFCKHTMCGERICTLYKKYNTPKSPEITQARSCPYYKLATTDENGTPIYQLSPTYYQQSPGWHRDFEPYYEVIMHK